MKPPDSRVAAHSGPATSASESTAPTLQKRHAPRWRAGDWGGGKVNNTSTRAVRPRRPGRVTGADVQDQEVGGRLAGREPWAQARVRGGQRRLGGARGRPGPRGRAPSRGRAADTPSRAPARHRARTGAGLPAGGAFPAVRPGLRHAPRGRTQLRAGTGPGPRRRVSRRGAAVRPGVAGGGGAAAGESARGGRTRRGGDALARGPKCGRQRGVQRLRGCGDVLAAAAATAPR